MDWRWLALWLAAWLAPLAQARASGEDDRCAAVWALSGLATAEQQGLHELCAKRQAPTRSHAPLLAALAARATWESAALGSIAAGGGPHVDVGGEPGHEGRALRLQALRGALRAELVRGHASTAAAGDRRCGWVRAAFDAYVADLEAGEVPLPPIAEFALADDRCLGLPAEAVAEVNFLTIPTAPGTSLTVVAGAGERAVIQWIAPEEAIARGSRRIFVVAVPRWSAVTVEARRGEGEPPARWHGFVSSDQTVWDRSPETGCMRISIGLEADTTLLLDGRPLTRGASLARRTVAVVGGGHELVALRCRSEAGARRCSVSFREALTEAARTTTRNLCQDISIDLTRRNSVMVLGATAAPGCDAGVAFQIGAQASEYLAATQADTGRDFRDIAAMASMTEALAALKTNLNPTAGTTIGGQIGDDGLEQLGTVAKEAWRQGIDSLLTFELRCANSPGAARTDARASGTSYTLVGARLAVGDVLAGERSDVTGLDLRRVRIVESIQVAQASQMAAAVASLIDRLFAVDHLRILGEGGTLMHRRQAELEVAVYRRAMKQEGAAMWTPTVEAILVARDGQEQPRLCGQLAATERRATVAALLRTQTPRGRRAAVRLRRVDAGEDEANTRSAMYRATIDAGPPGTYLVTARWKDGPVQDATCVSFESPQREVWLGVGAAPDVTTMAGIRQYQWVHARFQVGYTFYRPLRWLGFGQVFVYSYSKYASRSGLPSWQDVTVAPEGSTSTLRWARHAVMTGPTIELRTRDATWPIELRARAAAVFGIGIVDVSEIEATLDGEATSFPTVTAFDGGDHRRLTPNLDLTLDLGFSYTYRRLVVGPSLLLGAIAVNEMWSAAHATTALNGGGLLLGINLVIGGAW